MEFITLKEFAKELNLDRSNLRKYILNQQIEFLRVRTDESKGQETLALTLDDAEIIREIRDQSGFSNNEVFNNGDGFFYIIQLVPDLDDRRIKLGYSGNPEVRLKAHQTSAPTAILIKSWECKKCWESTIIDSITRIECQLIKNEVYNCDDLNNLIDRANDIFKLLP